MSTASKTVPASAAFDQIAARYDDLFTATAIGRAQRRAVWKRLKAGVHQGDRVLEINCGTGEDAAYLARLGAEVVALDASEEMIKRARQKQMDERVELHCASIESLASFEAGAPFDVVLSNFSGLNCVRDLAAVACDLVRITNPGARLFLSIYSRTCVWEVFWYLLHGDMSRATRRAHLHSAARIGDTSFDVFYHSIADFRAAFAQSFNLRTISAVGLFVPPSYLEPFASRHPRALRIAERLDSMLAGLPLFRRLGDHVLLEFERTGA